MPAADARVYYSEIPVEEWRDHGRGGRDGD
jgi:hypothetical protein